MGNQLNKAVRVSELAAGIGLDYSGPDDVFFQVNPLSSVVKGGLCFSKVSLTSLEVDGAVIIAPRDTILVNCSVLFADSPRLAFAKALIWIENNIGFIRGVETQCIHPTATISPSAYIGQGVTIDAGSVIGHCVVINDGVRIGSNCIIKSGSIIGEDGFGFERDMDGLPIRLVHLGSVYIGNFVEIGSLSTVCKGTLEDTVVQDYVKIDDHVHVAHNCLIKKGAILIAFAEISGGVEIGEFAWIGPSVSIIQKLKIGDHAFVGIGANVLRNVESGVTVIGNPAKTYVPKSKK
ncbi:MAG: UDP-3-O-[3-hydroxymyristoyl] glucosamine N-acyltransferase [Desulforhopalus sp.]|jgi:UDP-3-O-[3-hydroxymyristoyl] glucosamine N-acyltransferase